MTIAIASGKGGTGKTTIAVNLATLISKTEHLFLTDLDVEEPDSGIFFSGEQIYHKDIFEMIPEWIVDKCTSCGNCQEVCNFNAIIQLKETIMVFPELCHSCFACSELCPGEALPMHPHKIGRIEHFKDNGLDLIEGRLDIGQEQAVQLISQTKEYVNSIRANKDIVIYDSPPGTSCPVIEATKDVDLVILVTEPTPFGLHDLKLAVDTVKKMKRDIAVIINRDGTGNDIIASYCKKESIPIIARIPNQRNIAELYSKGKLIYPYVPEFKQQLQKIADYVLMYHQEK